MKVLAVKFLSSVWALLFLLCAPAWVCPSANEIPGTDGIRITDLLTNSSVVNVVRNTDGTDDGLKSLLDSMNGSHDVSFYNYQGRGGLVARDDVIIIKINAQWAERGSTNNDLLNSLISYIVHHPGGFTGEIIVADNGQGNIGSASHRAKLNWTQPNSKNKTTNAETVINSFSDSGYKVSGMVWDNFTTKLVNEFDSGDSTDGFVVERGTNGTGLRVSYPKFTTKYGTRISFKKGVWDEADKSYDSQRLKVINMPILKPDFQNYVDGVFSSYLGTASNILTAMSPMKSIKSGGMATQMLETRFPILNILDMIYMSSGQGSVSPYRQAIETNIIAASTDPAALEYWAVKNVMLPLVEKQASRDGNAKARERAALTNPENKYGFGLWLGKCCAELKKAGLPSFISPDAIRINEVHHENSGAKN